MSDSMSRFISEAGQEIQFAAEDAFKRFERLCGSPIEVMVLAALTFGWKLAEWARGDWATAAPEQKAVGVDMAVLPQGHSGFKLARSLRLLVVVPQYPWQGYRIDFAFFLKGDEPMLFVECDGHEFHERTPDQAERDRTRDRLVQKAGIPIIRFTGREIYRDPFKCAAEIIDHVCARMGRE